VRDWFGDAGLGGELMVPSAAMAGGRRGVRSSLYRRLNTLKLGPVYPSDVSLMIFLVNRRINIVRIRCKRVVPERGRCSDTRSGRRAGKYQVYSGVPAEVAEEIRQLRARVAIVLQRAEIAIRTLAA
jgi:hypothetical protein